MQPISIPATTPIQYISFKHALNLRCPGEDTGEWHFLSAFFNDDDFITPRSAPIAGKDGLVDTTPSLGDKGIREMSAVLESSQVQPANGPVYVANHYRAITDLVMLQLKEGNTPTIANVRAINQWLDTEEQISHLVSDYLKPLGSQLDKPHQEIFDEWIVTVQYD